LLQVRNKGRKWSQGGSVGIVGSYGTRPAGEEQIIESQKRWLSRYGKEIQVCLLQVRNKGRIWSQGGSVGIVGSYGTVPAGEEENKETEHRLLSQYGNNIRDCWLQVRKKGRKQSRSGSVGIVGNYETGCRRSRTRDGSGAEAAQLVR
jgi:hypothetical protein